MLRIGVVAEGVTDHMVIEAVVMAALREVDEDIEVLPLQPPVAGMSQQDFGGWEQVLLWLRNRQYRQFVQFDTDVLIIQIDTDVCDLEHFGVSRFVAGRELEDLELVAMVRARLEREIDEEFLRERPTCLVFAVAVNEIECWLLPLLFDNAKASKTRGCCKEASHYLRQHDRDGLASNDGTKFPRAYMQLVRDFKKRKVLDSACKRSPSLDAFVTELRSRCAPRPPNE